MCPRLIAELLALGRSQWQRLQDVIRGDDRQDEVRKDSATEHDGG